MNSRIIGLDVIRVIAAAMVVAIHSNVYYLYPKDGSLTWFIEMEFTALCVVSVPLFFMVSGAVNAGRNNIITLDVLFKRKLPKLIIPFFLWSIIYVSARIGIGKMPLSLNAFLSLIWEPAYYQFWFIYSLIGMYICIPIFQYLIQNANKVLLIYILKLWFLFSIILPLAIRYIPGFKISEHFNLIFLEGYWGYFFLGAYLKKYPIANPLSVGCILTIIGTLLTGCGAIIEFYNVIPYYGYVYTSYLLPGVVVSSLGLFLIFSNINYSSRTESFFTYLSERSMGVYYVHTMIIGVIEIYMNTLDKSLHWMLLKWLIACFVSLFVVELIKRIPLLNKYLL